MKDSNPLEYMIRLIEEQKAEILLKLQHDYLDMDFTDRVPWVCYEDVPEEDIIEKDDKLYYHSINFSDVTSEAQDYNLRTYQKLQNFINFLKKLKWEDFDTDVGSLITIERSLTPCQAFELIIKRFDESKREILGEPPHCTYESTEYQEVYDMEKIDWDSLDKPKQERKGR